MNKWWNPFAHRAMQGHWNYTHCLWMSRGHQCKRKRDHRNKHLCDCGVKW